MTKLFGIAVFVRHDDSLGYYDEVALPAVPCKIAYSAI